jgi:proline iminopeptidase
MINSRISNAQQEYLDSIENSVAFKNFNPATFEEYYKVYLTSYFSNPNDAKKLSLGFDSISVPKINNTNGIVRANLGKYDIHNKLRNINCKTLIMQGTESVFSIEGAMAIHERIPTSEIHIFEDCGHFEYIENPKKFKNLILEFYELK